MLEEEISDGELTDLLAEVDEAPSTSRRLRPSTVDRPSSASTERRRSARVQTRTSSDGPRPRPQTHWVSVTLSVLFKLQTLKTKVNDRTLPIIKHRQTEQIDIEIKNTSYNSWQHKTCKHPG